MGIGTSSPQELLEISGNSSPAIEIDNTSQRWRIGAGWAGGTSSELFIQDKTDNRLDVLLDGTGNVKVASGNLVIGTAGKGIDFSVNSNAGGMSSELLDSYEEGTFTPTLSFGGGTTGIVYNGSYHSGVYTKIGNRVFYNFFMVLSSKGSSTGNATITGLPFTNITLPSAANLATVGILNQISFADTPQALQENGASVIALQEVSNAGAVSTLTNANFENGSQLRISGSFEAQ